MKTFLSVTLLLAMVSVGTYPDAQRAQSASGDNPSGKVTIYFGRGGCPNECSVYEMTIRPDRSVEYEGKEFTRLLGKRTYTISAEAYKAIVDAVRRARVEQLKDEYKPVPGRDGGTITLRVSWGRRTKQIIHFQPSADAPDELNDLEEAILKYAYPSKELVPQ